MSADKSTQAAFVRAVKHRLVDIGWSAKMLAGEVGIYQSRWSEIASGKTSISLEMVERICQAVGLSVTFTPAEGGQP